ncbi:MAG: hydroxyacid dehydrogenase [Clostridia bacterium]|nr:hydroxyacid dehydrogenase [Clostridia bacterium]
MKILIAEPLGISAEALKAFITPLEAVGHQVICYEDKPNAQALSRRAAEADALVIANTPLPASVIAVCPHLRYIDVAFTGVDHIDLEACRQRGIPVSNAAGYSDLAVAELTVCMAISLLRRLPECDGAVRALSTSAGLRGGEIAGKTVGIIGLGRIGLRVARLMQAFGAAVVANSPHEKREALERGIRYLPLEELLALSDIVTLHAPNNASTRGMMGAAQFAQMKTGALFINCARGALVDQQALADALNSGHLAGAAVDVYPAEPPLSEDDPLLHAKNCILTPHIGFDTREAMLRRAETVFDNLNAWLDGAPKNLV